MPPHHAPLPILFGLCAALASSRAHEQSSGPAVALDALRACDGDTRGVDFVAGEGDVQFPRVFWAHTLWAASWAARGNGALEVWRALLGADGRRLAGTTRV